MRVFNFGSLNIDHVYTVDHFVRPGETLACAEYRQHVGGKGLNQSVALARAGCGVCHAGKIGPDGEMLVTYLVASGVDARFVQRIDSPTGHTVIQVDAAGQNSILLFGGANQRITLADAELVFADAEPGDVLLLQNEISALPEIMRLAADKQMRIFFNPAPMGPEVLAYPLDCIDLFICNESEAQALSGESETEAQIAFLRHAHPRAVFLLTLGSRGACFVSADGLLRVPARQVRVTDTTAAGDTFIGYFLAGWLRHGRVGQALEYAAQAAALCVERPGAAASIPGRDEVDAFIKTG